MPGMENFAGLKRIVALVPDVPVVVTSPSERRAEIVDAISNGARGYFSLSTKSCVLQHALPLIMLGERYIPVSAFRGGASLPPDPLAPKCPRLLLLSPLGRPKSWPCLQKVNPTRKLLDSSRCLMRRGGPLANPGCFCARDHPKHPNIENKHRAWHGEEAGIRVQACS